MKKILGMSLVAFIASTGAFAQTAPKMYVGAGIGYTLDTEIEDSDLDLDKNMNFSVAFGLNLTDAFRVEGEISHYLDVEESHELTNGVDTFTNDWKIDNTTYMLNGYFSLPVKSIVVPYVGLGLGYSHKLRTYVDRDPLDSGVRKDRDDAFAYQAMLGADFIIPNSAFKIGLEYRYLHGTFTGTSGEKDYGVDQQAIQAKVRYAF